VVSGSGTLTKIDSGTLLLTGTNTYTGGTTLTAGTIKVGNDSALGTGSLAMATGTTLETSVATQTLANAVAITGTGTVDTNAGNTLTLSGVVSGGALTKIDSGTLVLTGANTYTGTTTLSGGTIQVGSNTALGTGALSMADGTTLDAGAANRTLANAVGITGTSTVDTNATTLTLGGVVSGSGTLTKIGDGTLVLSGTSNLSGATTVSGGSLKVTGGIGNSAVTVESGASLGGTGTVGALTIKSGATLTPGMSPGTLTVAGNLSLQTGSTTEIEVSPIVADKIVVTGTATLAGTLALINTGGSYPLPTSYTLLEAGTPLSGSFTNITGVTAFGVLVDPVVVYNDTAASLDGTNVNLLLNVREALPFGASVLTTRYLGSYVAGYVVGGSNDAQFNSAPVTALVDTSTITTFVDGASNGSFINSSNTADAFGSGNRLGMAVDLALLGSAGIVDGIAIGTVSSNTGTITATASNQAAGVDLSGFTSGSVQLSSNSVDAVTTINDGSGAFAVTVNNAVPIGYTNTAAGPATATFGSTTATTLAGGTLVAANTQVSAGADSFAKAENNSVTLLLTDDLTAATSVNGSAVMNSNNVGATFTANTRTTNIAIAADNASFGGTAVIANNQSFDGNAVSGVDNALNTNSNVTATVANGSGAAAFSSSSLSVNSNLITSAASGNVLGGTITLADGLSYNLTAGTNTSSARLDGIDADGLDFDPEVDPFDLSATGALTIASTQINDDATAAKLTGSTTVGGLTPSFRTSTVGGDANLAASTVGADITAIVENPVNSAITLSANRVTAAATGNSLTMGIASGTGSALFDGSATLANRQVNGDDFYAFSVTANTTTTTIAATVGDASNGTVSGSSVGMNANIVASSAVGSRAAQTIDLSAATVTTSADYATLAFNKAPALATEEIISTDGAVTIANRQLNQLAPVTANTTGTRITLTSNDFAGVTANSQLSVTNNIQQAYAVGSDSANAVSLAGTTVGSGVGVANSQRNGDSSSTVSATTTGSAYLVITDSLGNGAAGSSAGLTGNRTDALATGVTTANTLNIDAQTVAYNGAATGGQTLDLTGNSSVTAAYALLNDQDVLGAVTATSTPVDGTSAFLLSIGNAVNAGSSVDNNSNTLTAKAQGAVSANSNNLNIGGTLSNGTAAAGSIGKVAVVANVQSIAAGANVLADVDSAAIEMVKTTVGGALTASSISSSANRIQAFADGANATNNLAVSATTISAAAGVTAAPNVGTTAAGAVSTANTAFAVANAQISGTGTVIAKIDEPAVVSSLVTGATSGSNVSLNGNVIDAFGVSNKATNGLSLKGTTIATDAGVLNVQSSNAPVASTIGTGADATTAASRADAGVIAEFDANVSGSAVAVNSNVTRGSAIGNVGNNTLAVSATTLSGDGTAVKAAAVGSVDGIATATGDYSLANSQSLGDTSESKTNVAAAYGIDVGLVAGAATTNSRLSVSSNNQFAEALGNSGTNRIALTATGAGAAAGVDPTAALSNVQDGNAAEIVSVSKMTVFANAESSASSVAINGNSNTALGVINNAVNSIGVSAVMLDGAATVGGIVAATNTTTADYALNSVQGASGSVASTARSDIYNLDKTETDTAGTTGSAITLTGNATTAEGSANRISNQSSASATENGATAGLNNSQASAAGVTVNATSSVGYGLASLLAVVPATDSSISVDGNGTTALARGNSASNALNYNATSYSGPASTTLAAIGTTATVDAAVAMRNGQNNSGAVGATSTGAAYTLELNSGTGAGALNSSTKLANNSVAANGFGNVASNALNATTSGATAPSVGLLNAQSNDTTGTVSTTATGTTFTLILNSDGIGATNSNAMMANNTLSSNAYGNVATNSLTMAAFGAGVPSSAVSSVQSNAAAISATATNVTFGMTVGSNSGSALRVGGNNTTAQAVANSSVNSINGGN
jgi:autotransporter-associated beta strand protein